MAFSSPAAMAQAQRAAEAQSMKSLQDRREQTRQDFFKGRPDISNDRLDRRQIQSDLYEKFKQEQMKPVLTTSGKPTGAYQSVMPGGPTLSDEANRLARMYGPTMKEIGSDIGYGLGNIARGFGDFIGKGGAIGSVLSDIYSRIKGGAAKGIETVGSLYDNLRQTFSGKPNYTINRGGGSVISSVTETPMYNNVSNRGMNIPVSIAQPVAYSPTTPDRSGFIPEGYGGITSVPFNSGYLPEGYSYGLGALPDYYDQNNVLGNIYLNSQGYNVPVQFKNGGSVDKYAGLGYKLR